MDQASEASLVELAKAGDQHAFAELYNRYFDPVYDFVARMTRDRDEAADIAQDTFLKAMNALGGLQKGASFKSWVFTIARNTALNRLEKASRTRPLAYSGEDGEEVTFDVVDTDRFADPEEAAQASAIASLVWEAAAGLDPKQLSLLDLHLRQGLDSAEIADVLGVTKNNGYVMLNRLKKAVEDSIGAFIMFKSGRQYCESLDSVLSKADIQAMSPETRKLVDRHVAQCPDCEERKKKLAPLAAFAAFGAIGAPAGAKAHILEGLMQQWPGPAAAGAGGAGGSGSGGGSPLPRTGAGGAGGAGPGVFKAGAFLSMFAAALIALLFIPQSPVALSRLDGGGPEKVSPAAGAIPSPTAPGTASASPTAAPTRTPTPAPTPAGETPQASPTADGSATAVPTAQAPTATGTLPPTSTPSPTKTSTPTATATATQTATPTATSTPCVPVLQGSVQSLSIVPGGSKTFTISNQASCAASYSVGTTGGLWLSASPAGGTIPANGTAEVTVSVDAGLLPQTEGSYFGEVRVNNGAVLVSVTTSRGGKPPVIQSVSGQCLVTALGISFTATITDDVAVGSAAVTFTASGGQQHTVQLFNTTGTSWAGTLTGVSARNATGFVIVATDLAGHQATASFNAQC
jgi:RNA polymerase sigma factor (sigma-70 family)